MAIKKKKKSAPSPNIGKLPAEVQTEKRGRVVLHEIVPSSQGGLARIEDGATLIWVRALEITGMEYFT